MSLEREVAISAIVAGLIYAVQLFLGIQCYKKHKVHAYRGHYEEIPKPTEISQNKAISYSLHYSGFLVGYMAWGYTICFHFVLVIMIIVRLIPWQNFYIQLGVTLIVPILVIYAFKMVGISCVSRYFFTIEETDTLTLTNRKSYGIILYFMFFIGQYNETNDGRNPRSSRLFQIASSV